jgi:hypothetical protein
LKRPELASKKLPKFLDPRIVENAALKGRIAELETQINDLNRKLNGVERDNAHLRRDRDHWYELIQLQRAAQNQWREQSNVAVQAQTEMLRAMAQSQQLGAQAQQNHQLNSWHDCTCVPGRAAAFGVLRTPGDGA